MALMAVPESRLVMSVLHLNRNVTNGVNVFIHTSPFFIFNAPVFGSTSVCSYKGLGNLALHFPCLLIQVGLSFFATCSFAERFLLQLCTLEWSTSSSTVFLNLVHQHCTFLQSEQSLQLFSLHIDGGDSGKVCVGSA